MDPGEKSGRRESNPRHELGNRYPPALTLYTPVDPLKELVATIENASPQSVCRYPSRYSFIASELGISLTTSHCEELTRFLSHFEGTTVSLMFVSSYTGSPASYFGHTILRFNKPNNLFFSPTIKRAWARLPAKVYEVDPFVCPKCGAEMKVIAIIEDPDELGRILRHLIKIGRSPPGFDPDRLN